MSKRLIMFALVAATMLMATSYASAGWGHYGRMNFVNHKSPSQVHHF